MAHIVDSRVKDTTTTTGTGTVTLANSAPTGFRTFGSVLATGDTTFYCIVGAAEWEIGLGTYNATGPTLARTTVLDSSNAAALVNFSAGTKDVFITAPSERMNLLDNGLAMNLPAVAAEPAAPAAGLLALYSRLISGRMMFKAKGPSGLDSPLQPAFFGNNVVMYAPGNGSAVGTSFGTTWAVGTTINHPTPAAGIYTQMKRTTSTNVVTTTNQTLGVSNIATAPHAQFWRGNSTGLGGFFFFARFGIETLTAGSPNATRLFVGLQSGTTNILASDTIPSISCVGLWHDTTDAANVINLLTKDGTTATKSALAGSPTTPYSTGQAYDFYMFAKPNDSTIYYRLDNLNTGAILSDSSITTTVPAATTFMGSVIGMSNGTANTVASTVAIGVNRIYVESDH